MNVIAGAPPQGATDAFDAGWIIEKPAGAAAGSEVMPGDHVYLKNSVYRDRSDYTGNLATCNLAAGAQYGVTVRADNGAEPTAEMWVIELSSTTA